MTTNASRRDVLRGLTGFAATAASIGIATPARAATKVRFLTSWFAEAEHGGFYQAKATGIYDKAGLDVSLLMGGPQVNGAQLMLGGESDLMMGYDIQTLSAVQNNTPLITVAAGFQFELQCMVAHPTINAIADLKGHTILAATSSHTTWWPWLKEKFGFTDDMLAPYNFTYTRFQNDPSVAQQGFVTYDQYQLDKQQIAAKIFPFSDEGYPTYGCTIVTTQSFLQKSHDVVARFVRASLEGWKSYIANPAPGNALIKAANAQMDDGQLAFSVNKLRTIKAISSGDAATMGVGTMTDARWKKTRDFLVRAQLLKDTTDWKAAYTTDIVKNLHIMA